MADESLFTPYQEPQGQAPAAPTDGGGLFKPYVEQATDFGSSFALGVKASVPQFQAGMYGLAGLAGSLGKSLTGGAIGQGLESWGAEGAKKNLAEAQAYQPAEGAATFSEADSFQDYANWAGWNAGNQLLNIASLAVPGIMGAKLGATGAGLAAGLGGSVTKALGPGATGASARLLAREAATKAPGAVLSGGATPAMAEAAAGLLAKGAQRGAGLGVWAGGSALEAGGMQNEQTEAGLEPTPWTTLGAAGLAGALELPLPMKLAGRLGLGKVAKEGAEAVAQKAGFLPATGRALKNTAGVLKDAILLEGLPEAAQGIIEDLVQENALKENGKPYNWDKAFDPERRLEEGAVGTLLGTIFGGAGKLAEGRVGLERKIPDLQKELDAARTAEEAAAAQARLDAALALRDKINRELTDAGEQRIAQDRLKAYEQQEAEKARRTEAELVQKEQERQFINRFGGPGLTQPLLPGEDALAASLLKEGVRTKEGAIPIKTDAAGQSVGFPYNPVFPADIEKVGLTPEGEAFTDDLSRYFGPTEIQDVSWQHAPWVGPQERTAYPTAEGLVADDLTARNALLPAGIEKRTATQVRPQPAAPSPYAVQELPPAEELGTLQEAVLPEPGLPRDSLPQVEQAVREGLATPSLLPTDVALGRIAQPLEEQRNAQAVRDPAGQMRGESGEGLGQVQSMPVEGGGNLQQPPETAGPAPTARAGEEGEGQKVAGRKGTWTPQGKLFSEAAPAAAPRNVQEVRQRIGAKLGGVGQIKRFEKSGLLEILDANDPELAAQREEARIAYAPGKWDALKPINRVDTAERAGLLSRKELQRLAELHGQGKELDGVVGKKWAELPSRQQKALVDATERTQAEYDPATGKTRVWSDAKDPVGALLHEGTHAGDELVAPLTRVAYAAQIDRQAKNGDKASMDAVRVAEKSVASWIARQEKPPTEGAVAENRRKEQLAYFVEHSSLRQGQKATGLLKRLLGEVKAWFATTDFAQRLAARGMAFKLDDATALSLAKRALKAASERKDLVKGFAEKSEGKPEPEGPGPKGGKAKKLPWRKEKEKAPADGKALESIAPNIIENVTQESLTNLDKPDAFFYYVTSAPNAERIQKVGFGSEQAMFQAGGMPEQNKNKTFFTDRNGVSFWQERVELQLEAAFDEPPAVVVLRVPKSSVPSNVLTEDVVGSREARAPAWKIATKFVTVKEYGKEPAAELGGVAKRNVLESLDETVLTKSPEYKRWAEGLPLATNRTDYRGGPAVFLAYHGTTHPDITRFEERGNAEGWLGVGPYFTTEPEDASENYAGVGPDLTARIELAAEQIGQDVDRWRMEELLEDYYENSPKGQALEQIEDWQDSEQSIEDAWNEDGNDALFWAATQELKGPTEGLIMPQFVKLKKPADLTGETDEVLTYEQEQDEEGDFVGEPTGTLMDWVAAARGLEWTGMDVDAFTTELMEEGMDGGLTVKDVHELLRKGNYYGNDDNGEQITAGGLFRMMAKDLGYDGIVMDAWEAFNARRGFGGVRMGGMKGVKPDTLHIVPFEPENKANVKNALGSGFSMKRGTGVLESQEQPAESLLWRSALGEAVRGSKQEKASGAQWLGFLRNQKGVKQEELDDTGLEDWLGTQEGTVGKGEVEDFLKKGGVRVEEVLSPVGKTISTYPQVIDMQVPGGKNYRELLITVPAKGPISPVSMEEQAREELGYTMDDTIPEDEQAELDDRIQELTRSRGPTEQATYRSSHWSEPNVLVHIRFNEREDAEGKRVLFMEEVQSDWHQEGRKKGQDLIKDRARMLDAGYVKQLEDGRWGLYTPDGTLDDDFADKITAERQLKRTADIITNPSKEALAKAQKELPTAGYKTKGATGFQERKEELLGLPPDAPLKSAWPLLGMKRAIRWAAENGFDSVAWTPGEVQAERYDLSKQISEVTFDPKESGDYSLGTLYAYDLKGNEVMAERDIEPEELEKYIGKEPAAKIAEQIQERERNRAKWTAELDEDSGKWNLYDANGEVQYDAGGDVLEFRSEQRALDYAERLDNTADEQIPITLRGLELKVGGEGMRGFYDKILPNELGKYAKKFGTRVGETQIALEPEKQLIAQRENMLRAQTGEEPVSGGKTQKVWNLPLSPALKEEAMRGQVLYSEAQAARVSTLLRDHPSLSPEEETSFAKSNAQMKEAYRTPVEKGKDLLAKAFAPGGLLGTFAPGAYPEIQRRDARQTMVDDTVERLVRELEREGAAAWGQKWDKLPQDRIDQVGAALAGDNAALGNLPEKVKNTVTAMRLVLDPLSKEYALELKRKIAEEADGSPRAAAQQALLEVILKKTGSYLNRSFQMFDDPNWYSSVSDVVKNRARKYLMQEHEMSEAEASAYMNRLLKNGTAYDSFTDWLRESKVGMKDMRVLIRRKEIAPEMLDLMGVYTDPRINFAKSAAKLSRLVYNTKLQNELRRIGLENGWLFEKDQLEGRPAGITQTIGGGKPYEALAELETYPEVKQALRDILQRNENPEWLKGIMQVALVTKWAKTVGSPLPTGVRNYVSAWMGLLANADWSGKGFKDALAGWKEYLANIDAGNQHKNLQYKKLLGVSLDTPYAGEMKDLSEQAGLDALIQAEGGVVKPGLNKAQKGLFKAKKGLERFYQFGDDFVKIIAFESQRKQFDKALGSRLRAEYDEQRDASGWEKPIFGRVELREGENGKWTFVDAYGENIRPGQEEYTTEQEARQAVGSVLAQWEIDNRAAERIRNTYMTYSMVGALPKWLARFPLTGTFVSFPVEVLRTVANQIHYLVSDLKDPELRGMGRRRLVGMAAAGASAHALVALMQSALGVDDDELEDARQAMPEWNKLSNMIPVGRDEKGRLEFFDFGFVDLYQTWRLPFNAWQNRDPLEEDFKNVVKELALPFVGMDITAKAFYEVLKNEKATGGPIWDYADGPREQGLKILDHIRKPFTPSTLLQMEKIAKAADGQVLRSGEEMRVGKELGGLFGWKTMTANPNAMLWLNHYGFAQDRRAATGGLVRAINDPNRVEEQSLREKFDQALETRQEVYGDFLKKVGAAQRLGGGMSNFALAQELKNLGVAQREIPFLLKGRIPPWLPDSRTFLTAEKKGEVLYSEEQRKEIAQRRRQVLKWMAEEARKSRAG